MNECWMCMGAHDPAYHASVRRVRQWLLHRTDVVPMPPPRQVSRVWPTGLGAVHDLRSPASKRKAARK